VADVIADVHRCAIELAVDAGRLLRQWAGRVQEVRHKGEIDLVTEVDTAAEQLIAAGIAARFPDHALIGEEGSATGVAAGEAEWTWVVDPLDGTTNFAHGYPHFAVSILVMRGDEMAAAAVYDPTRDELFSGTAGGGAWLNGRPMRVSTTATLIGSLFGTGFAYQEALRVEQQAVWNAMQRRSRGIRREGSAALAMCYVAAGRLDGFWERPINAWDIGAGALLVREAGGRLTSLSGGPFEPFAGEVIASNGLVHDGLVSAIGEAIAEHAATAATI
jgi:myo-inositol-1(or 4)-monophosphatase